MYKIIVSNLGFKDFWIEKELHNMTGTLNQLLTELKEQLKEVNTIDDITITKNFSITEKDFLKADDLIIKVVETDDVECCISILLEGNFFGGYYSSNKYITDDVPIVLHNKAQIYTLEEVLLLGFVETTVDYYNENKEEHELNWEELPFNEKVKQIESYTQDDDIANICYYENTKTALEKKIKETNLKKYLEIVYNCTSKQQDSYSRYYDVFEQDSNFSLLFLSDKEKGTIEVKKDNSNKIFDILETKDNNIEKIVKNYIDEIQLNCYQYEIINITYTEITMQGLGLGKGDIVKVYSRDTILEFIEALDKEKIVKTAFENMVKDYKNGYATINLKTGELEGLSLSSNESLQAIDSQYITLYTFESYFNISDLNLLDDDKPYTDQEKEVTAMIENIVYHDNILDYTEINQELDFFYNI